MCLSELKRSLPETPSCQSVSLCTSVNLVNASTRDPVRLRQRDSFTLTEPWVWNRAILSEEFLMARPMLSQAFHRTDFLESHSWGACIFHHPSLILSILGSWSKNVLDCNLLYSSLNVRNWEKVGRGKSEHICFNNFLMQIIILGRDKQRRFCVGDKQRTREGVLGRDRKRCESPRDFSSFSLTVLP